MWVVGFGAANAKLADYCSKLTYGNDRLVAISVLAQECEGLLGDGEEYLAGLWKRDLHRQLLWRMGFTEVVDRERCML